MRKSEVFSLCLSVWSKGIFQVVEICGHTIAINPRCADAKTVERGAHFLRAGLQKELAASLIQAKGYSAASFPSRWVVTQSPSVRFAIRINAQPITRPVIESISEVAMRAIYRIKEKSLGRWPLDIDAKEIIRRRVVLRRVLAQAEFGMIKPNGRGAIRNAAQHANLPGGI